MSPVDPTRLYSALLNTGLQSKNNPLYQVIYNLIGVVNSINDEINGIGSGSTGSTGATGAQGIQGVIGPPGLDGYDYSSDVMFPPGSLATASAGPPGSHDLIGTANQVILSASGVGSLAGANDITLSLPQSIATTSTPQFAQLGIGQAPVRLLDIKGITEQFRISYDGIRRASHVLDLNGNLGVTLTGSGGVAAGFTYTSYALGNFVFIGAGAAAWIAYDASNYLSIVPDNVGNTIIRTVGTNPDLSLIPGGVGTVGITTGVTTGVTTASAFTLDGGTITSGTGFYAASASLTSGLLIDLQVSGTVAAASQTALNILTTGANGTAGITTYGAQISNTHSTNTSTNVALYLNASGGASANYGLIVNSGNVGIGTTSPANLLTVTLAQDTATAIVLQNSNNTTGAQASIIAASDVAQISLRAHATVRVATRYGVTLGGYTEVLGGNNGLLLGLIVAAPIVFGTNNTERMRILSTGEVGIGGTPTQKFEVFAGISQFNNTAGSAQIQIKDTTNTKTAFINANNDTLQFYGNGPTAERVRFDLANGRVGIGITPNFILDVQQTGTNPGINIDAVSGSNFRSTIGFGVDSGVTVGWIAGQGLGSTTTRDFYIFDVTASLTRIYIDTTGKVGIGTTAPAQMLDISSTAPSFQMTDTTASAKSLRLVTDANKANLYEAAGAAGDIMTWDLSNKRVGIVQGTPTAWLHLGIGASGVSSAPLKFTSGTNLATAEAGTVEWDAVQLYHTIDTSSGRGAIPVEQYFHLAADGGTISTIANFFGTNSNINLVASAYYIIDIYCYFLCTTAGAVTWTLTNNNAPTAQNIYYEMSPVTGIVAPPGTATMLVGQFSKDTTAARTIVTASLTTAVDHYMHIRIELQNSAGGTTFKIQATKGTGGTITPRVNSYWICRRISPNNIGTFAG